MRKIKKISLFLFFLILLFAFILFFIKTRPKQEYMEVYGSWYEDSGMLFTFSNHTFYWYKDFMDQKNNYYKGNLEIKSLCDLGLTKEEIKKEYGEISCKDYYELDLYPKELKSEEKEETYNGTYALKFALYFASEKEVYLYDFSKEKFYEVAKIENF